MLLIQVPIEQHLCTGSLQAVPVVNLQTGCGKPAGRGKTWQAVPLLLRAMGPDGNIQMRGHTVAQCSSVCLCMCFCAKGHHFYTVFICSKNILDIVQQHK